MAIKKKIAEKEELATVFKKSALSPEKEADFERKSEGPKTFVKNGIIVTDIGKKLIYFQLYVMQLIFEKLHRICLKIFHYFQRLQSLGMKYR